MPAMSTPTHGATTSAANSPVTSGASQRMRAFGGGGEPLFHATSTSASPGSGVAAVAMTERRRVQVNAMIPKHNNTVNSDSRIAARTWR